MCIHKSSQCCSLSAQGDLTPHCLCAYLQVESKVETLVKATRNTMWFWKTQMKLWYFASAEGLPHHCNISIGYNPWTFVWAELRLLKGEHKAIFCLPPLTIFPDNPQNFKWNPGALPFCNLIGQESDPKFLETMLMLILSHTFNIGSSTIPYASLLLATQVFFLIYSSFCK